MVGRVGADIAVGLIVAEVLLFFIIVIAAHCHLTVKNINHNKIEREKRQLQEEVMRLNQQNVALTSELNTLRYR
jgi:large-conductance mechanosensitive channel